jgi:fatty-acyl-CoA synthase
MALSGDGMSVWHADDGPLELVSMSIGEVLDDAAARAPKQQALVIDGFGDLGFDTCWTYEELRQRADCLARALIADGVAAGHRVALWAPNVPDWIVIELAVAKVGAVLVPLNPTYRAGEAAYILAETAASLLFLQPQFRQFDIAAEYQQLAVQFPELRAVTLSAARDATGDLETIDAYLTRVGDVTESALAERQSQVSTHDPAQIHYTSGTTGTPKGAVLTHHSLINDARLFADRWQVSAEDRWANPMPLFHTAGCAMVTLACICTTATHCLAVWFDPERVQAMIQRQRCTILETVPTMVTAILNRHPHDPADLSSLRLIGTGGAPVSAELGRRVRTELGTELRSVYGLTETSPLVAAAPVDAAGETGWTTAGPPLAHTDVRIVSAESDHPVPLGELGELQVRGYLVMAGYLDRPQATAATVDADGWLHTGDVARLTTTGDVQIVDRIKDMIIRGGENLYPAEIEAIIGQHPAVLESCVVGVPDDYYGEEAFAVVRLRESGSTSADGLREFMRAHVTHQKVPRYIRFVDGFPTTGSGKIRKRDVAADCAHYLANDLAKDEPLGNRT